MAYSYLASAFIGMAIHAPPASRRTAEPSGSSASTGAQEQSGPAKRQCRQIRRVRL